VLLYLKVRESGVISRCNVFLIILFSFFFQSSCVNFSVVLICVWPTKASLNPKQFLPRLSVLRAGKGTYLFLLFVLFVFSLCYLYLTPGYESKLPRARTGTVPRRLTLGVTLNHKSNLVPSETIGPPHHMSVGLYEAMGMSTFFSLWRDGGNQQPAKISIL